MKKISILFIVIFSMASCKNNQISVATNPSLDSMYSSKQDFTSINFSNKKDPDCGMPLKAEIGDSTIYKGKPIAFCSKGCKDEFMKNPSMYEVK